MSFLVEIEDYRVREVDLFFWKRGKGKGEVDLRIMKW